jgi:hypothetical protein
LLLVPAGAGGGLVLGSPLLVDDTPPPPLGVVGGSGCGPLTVMLVAIREPWENSGVEYSPLAELYQPRLRSKLPLPQFPLL